MENFDVKKDYYAILGVPVNADDQLIISSYLNAQAGKSAEELVEINKAFAILINHETRQAYTTARAKYLAGLTTSDGVLVERQNSEPAQEPTSIVAVQNPERVQGEGVDTTPRRRRSDRNRVVQEEQAPEETSKKGHKVIKGISITALILALLVAAGAVGKNWDNITSWLRSNGNRSAVVQTVDDSDITLIGETTTYPTPAPTADDITLIGDGFGVNAPTSTPAPAVVEEGAYEGMNQVKAFGNALDPAQVEERATRLLAYVDSVGGYNINTGLKWTLEDMKRLVLYFNGAYVPSNEANAFKMEDDLLAFACVPLNDPRIVRGVSFSVDCPTDGDYIADPVKFTDMLLMGDSYCYPYLQWLQEQWNIMITSDNSETRRIAVNQVLQSYADIMYGTGYKMTTADGREIVITDKDLTARSRINDGNIFRLYGLMIPIFGSDLTEQDFQVDGVNGVTHVAAIDLYLQLNVRCAEDIIQDAKYDEDGRIYFEDGITNTYGWIQRNTITAATDNLYFGNADYYAETQTYSLSK